MAKASVPFTSEPQPRLHNVQQHVQHKLLATKDPAKLTQVIRQHEAEIAAPYRGDDEGYLYCDEAAQLLSDALRHHRVPHQIMMGTLPDGETHNWVQVKGVGYDPTDQGVMAPDAQVADDYDPKHDRNVLAVVKAEGSLAKMALIHDDATKPMTVYRVQDENGIGPYDSSMHGNQDVSLAAKRMGLRTPLKDMGTERDPQPTPGRDFPRPEWLDHPERDNLRFGFEHPDHATAWFGGANMDDMAEHGFRLVPVLARKVYRSNSGKQVIFEPHDDEYEYAKDEMKVEAEPTEPHPAGEALDKAKLPMPKASAHHRITLPPGSAIGKAPSGAVGSVASANAVKVVHSDGSTSVKQVEAGMIRSQDPSGHPVSSREPNSR